MPLVFVLMNRRTKTAYEAVFEFINSKVFDLSGTKTFVTDFELAMRNALSEKYPLASFTACHFHFAQAVRRNATKINGLLDFIRKNELAKKTYYKMMYLPMWPPGHIDQIKKLLTR